MAMGDVFMLPGEEAMKEQVLGFLFVLLGVCVITSKQPTVIELGGKSVGSVRNANLFIGGNTAFLWTDSNSGDTWALPNFGEG